MKTKSASKKFPELKATAGAVASAATGSLKAFKVSVPSFGDEATGIVAAISPSKAKYASLRLARDAGFNLKFSEMRVVRASEFDDLVASQPTPVCWSFDYAQSKL